MQIRVSPRLDGRFIYATFTSFYDRVEIKC